MDVASDATHVVRFKELRFSAGWTARMFGSGVAYRISERGVESEVRVVTDDGREFRRSYPSGQVLVFQDIVHLPPGADGADESFREM